MAPIGHKDNASQLTLNTATSRIQIPTMIDTGNLHSYIGLIDIQQATVVTVSSLQTVV